MAGYHRCLTGTQSSAQVWLCPPILALGGELAGKGSMIFLDSRLARASTGKHIHHGTPLGYVLDEYMS